MHAERLLIAGLTVWLGWVAHAAPVNALAFASNGTVLAAAAGRNVLLIDAATGRTSGTYPCLDGRALALSFQPAGPLLAVGTGVPGEQGGMRLLDWRQQKWVGAVVTNRDAVTSVAFSPDGKWLAVASADKSASLFQVDHSNAKITPAFVLPGHSASVQAIAFSPDGQTLVTASVDRSLKVWSAADGKLLRSFGQHTDAVLALAFRPGTPHRSEAPPYCASGGDDRTVRIWQPTLGRMVRIIRSHEGPILALTFAPDGGSIFSTGQEGIVRRIDAESDQILGQWRASHDWVYSLAVSPDGLCVATGDWAGKVRRWSATGQPLPSQP